MSVSSNGICLVISVQVKEKGSYLMENNFLCENFNVKISNINCTHQQNRIFFLLHSST